MAIAIAMGWQKPDNVAGSSAPAIIVGSFVASAGLLFVRQQSPPRPAMCFVLE
jgi:hypothetical protein